LPSELAVKLLGFFAMNQASFAEFTGPVSTKAIYWKLG
jgi:hypothetical protein